jgi:hypothetical protein
VRIVCALLGRWALLGLLCQLVGTALIAYGFRLKRSFAISEGEMKPGEDFAGLLARLARGELREWPHVFVVAEHPCASKLGWGLVIVGFVLQIFAEVRSGSSGGAPTTRSRRTWRGTPSRAPWTCSYGCPSCSSASAASCTCSSYPPCSSGRLAR